MISSLAVQNLPASVPAFLRAKSAADEIAMLGPEEDRLRGSGESWDGDNDEGHFLDLADDGTIAGVVRLDAMPKNMAAYADALERLAALAVFLALFTLPLPWSRIMQPTVARLRSLRIVIVLVVKPRRSGGVMFRRGQHVLDLVR